MLLPAGQGFYFTTGRKKIFSDSVIHFHSFVLIQGALDSFQTCPSHIFSISVDSVLAAAQNKILGHSWLPFPAPHNQSVSKPVGSILKMQEADHFSPPPPPHQEKPLSSLTRSTVRDFSLAPCFHPGLQGYWLFSTQQSESSFKKRNQSRPLPWPKPTDSSPLTQVHCKCLTGPLRLCGFWPLTVSLASSSTLLPLTTALGSLALWFPLAEMLSSQIVTWLVS